MTVSVEILNITPCVIVARRTVLNPERADQYIVGPDRLLLGLQLGADRRRRQCIGFPEMQVEIVEKRACGRGASFLV